MSERLLVEREDPTWIEGGAGLVCVDDGGGSCPGPEPEGARPAVFFIHGLGGSSAVWRHHLAHQRRVRRAAAMDVRGMGRSQLADEAEMSIEAYAQDARLVIERLGLRRLVLVGHSFSGAILARLGTLLPDRVLGMLFVDTAVNAVHTPPEESAALRRELTERFAEAAVEWMEPMMVGCTEELKAELREGQRSSNPRGFLGGYEAGLLFDARPHLDAFSGPRISVVAERFLHPGALHLRYRRRSPTGAPSVIKGVVMPEVSHWPMLDRPAEFDQILDGLLAQVEAKAGP